MCRSGASERVVSVRSRLFPQAYLAPHYAPLYWRDEQSGRLPAAVMQYLAHRVDGAAAPSEDDLLLLAAYLSYWIHAPAWIRCAADDAMRGQLAELQRRVVRLRTPDEVSAWLHEALELGIDPL